LSGQLYRELNACQHSFRSKIEGVTLIKAFPFILTIWFFGTASLFLGVRGFVPLVHRTIRRKEPSATDLKIARIVGYMGIVFGTIALIQALIQVAS
jgi:uncharacterized membrane protein YidH (DUF202 family)